MSGKVVGWAFDEGEAKGLELSRRFVLVAYADNADRWGKCFPGKKEIIGKTGASRATWYRAKGELVKEGLIEFLEDDKGREYVQLAVPWASHDETKSSQGEKRPPEAPSPPETNGSQGETPPSHGETGSNKEPSSNRHQPSCEDSAPTTESPDFGILSAGIAAPLRQAAEAKGADFNAHSIKRALDAYPDRDHAEEAEKFAAWHLSGKGLKAPLRVVAVSFKKWLKNSPAAEQRPEATVTQLPVKPQVSDAEILGGAEAAKQAWTEVRGMLQTAVPDATWRLWLEPLEPRGGAGNTLYVAAPEGIRAWTERRYSSLIAEALAEYSGPFDSVCFYVPVESAGAAA